MTADEYFETVVKCEEQYRLAKYTVRPTYFNVTNTNKTRGANYKVFVLEDEKNSRAVFVRFYSHKFVLIQGVSQPLKTGNPLELVTALQAIEGAH